MKNKKTAVKRKIKSAGKVVAKNAKVLVKKAGKEAEKIAKVLKKRWDKAEPEREKYKKEMRAAAEKAGAKGMKMLKSGLKNSIKIGGDIADVIKKDIEEIRSKKQEE
jgi:hypothetical protein